MEKEVREQRIENREYSGECMAFQIIEILDSQTETILVKALHHSNEVPVSIRGVKSHDILAGQSIQGEVGFDEILDWKVVSEFEDGQSGIWHAQDGVHLLGRVHSILDYGDGRIVIDVYIQNGPELFTVNLNATEEEAPDANDGLEIIVKKLFLFPVS